MGDRSSPLPPIPTLYLLDLYKKFDYFEAFVHESTILSPPAQTYIAHPGALLLRDYGQHTTPPPISRVYAIHHTILVKTISCKGQTPTHPLSLLSISLSISISQYTRLTPQGVNPRFVRCRA